MKKSLLIIIVIVSVSVGGVYYALSNRQQETAQNNQNYQNNIVSNNEYLVKDNYILVENKDFGYRFQYKNTLFRDPIKQDDLFKILGGDSIHGDPAKLKGYQMPEVTIIVYDRSLLNGLPLSKWVASVSTDKFENMSTNQNLKYVSTDYLTILDNKIIFLVNSDPLLNSSTPVLLFDNGKYLIELSKVYIPEDFMFDIASTIQVKFDGNYKGLTNEDINSIKSYFKNNEKF